MSLSAADASHRHVCAPWSMHGFGLPGSADDLSRRVVRGNASYLRKTWESLPRSSGTKGQR